MPPPRSIPYVSKDLSDARRSSRSNKQNESGFVQVRAAAIEDPSKNPRFWNARKTPSLILPQTPFKTQAVVEGFWFTCFSGHSCAAQHSSTWAQTRLRMQFHQCQRLAAVFPGKVNCFIGLSGDARPFMGMRLAPAIALGGTGVDCTGTDGQVVFQR